MAVFLKKIYDLLVEKISTYELFSYFFIGVVGYLIGISLKISAVVKIKEAIDSAAKGFEELAYFIFIYFLGLFISRVGTILESLLKEKEDGTSKFFVKFAPYSDYVAAEKKGDEKLPILTTQANLYRSLLGLVFIILCFQIKIPKDFGKYISENPDVKKNIVLIVLLIVFYISWRKQVGYVRNRVEAINNPTGDAANEAAPLEKESTSNTETPETIKTTETNEKTQSV